MTVADGSQTRLAYVVETTPGTTPATPSWKNLRYVSETLTIDKQTSIPDEIRSDGNVSDIVDVGRQVTGSINTLLSYSTFDDFLSCLFRAEWDNDVLKNGRVHKTLSLEKTFELGATDAFQRFRGCRVNTLDLSIPARREITANWGILGIGGSMASAIVTGATYDAETTTPVLNGGLNVGALSLSGVAGTTKLQSASVRITSNVYANDVIGSYEADSHGLGRFEVSGSITALFEGIELVNAILNHTDVGLSLTIGAAANQKYTLSLPKIKGMNGGPVVAGNGRAVLVEMPFQAKYDSGSSASMSITRAVA